MKKVLFSFLLISSVFFTAQATYYNLGAFWSVGGANPLPQWTWMSGTKNRSDEAPVYGTKGVAAAGNHPGTRNDSVSWIDSSNNLWLYGGRGLDSNLDYGVMGDLFKYDTSTNQWTWVFGGTTANRAANYGTKNISSASNDPGARRGSTAWVDATSGILWLFGGYDGQVYGSELWKYTIATGQWTWVHGPSTSNEVSVTGTITVASTSNYPGARVHGTGWRDSTGKLWMYGGEIYGSYFNDVWRYDTATDEWTWFKGDALSGTPVATYGTKGSEGASNTPGGRGGAVGWVAASDYLWFFGGRGLDNNQNTGRLNDIWRYNTSNNRWTWMVGSSTYGQANSPGTQNVASTSNVIGARDGHTLWKDNSGMIWIFGGEKTGATCDYYGNDFWRYNPTNNEVTWIAGDPECNTQGGTPGTKGTPSTSNLPSARYTNAGYWQDASNLFYLYGGYGQDSLGTITYQRDLWRFNATSGAWTWLNGETVSYINQGTYGTKGTPSSSIDPGARSSASLTADETGNIWLFGGTFSAWYNGCYGCSYTSLMKFDPTLNQWTWVSGDAGIGGTPTYGTKGVPSVSNKPPPLQAHTMARDPATGLFWLFAGAPSHTYTDVGSNNLWMYNPNTSEWTWVNGPGDTYDQFGVYGTKGTANVANIPGSRIEHSMVADGAGNLWVFGGLGYASSGSKTSLNDLWKYNIAADRWTWMGGSSSAGDINGVYGTKGTANSANTPGTRQHTALWVDSSNQIYMFGGVGRDSVNSFDDRLNDLWKFDGTDWTWMHGPSTTAGTNKAVVFGTQGVFDSANIPGARTANTFFQWPGGYFWLFGGFAQNSTATAGDYNAAHDIWKYDPATNQWACASACSDSDYNDGATYGTKGTPSPTNQPGSRPSGNGAIDRFGTIWIYGDSYDVGGQLWRWK